MENFANILITYGWVGGDRPSMESVNVNCSGLSSGAEPQNLPSDLPGHTTNWCLWHTMECGVWSVDHAVLTTERSIKANRFSDNLYLCWPNSHHLLSISQLY